MTRAVVVCVGDELLTGLVVNTNLSMIGEMFLHVGIRVEWSTTVGDQEDAIVDVLQRACDDADVVIVTGGLGPTQDDLTTAAIAKMMGVELERDESVVDEIRGRFKAFGRVMPESNAKQADRPRGATFIPNPYGTAPGIRAEHSGAVLYAIPGVPGEARHMLEDAILPELTAAGVASLIRSRIYHCVGLPESDLADRFGDLATAPNPKMAFLPGGGEIRLRFVATGSTVEECDAFLNEVGETVMERVGEFVFGTDDETLEGVVGKMLQDRGLTVATAESCTAGMLAARIANVPGAADYLRGGVVTYATELKASELDVPRDVLEREGAVSEDVARAMCIGVKQRLGADVALSVTCAAGPDPQDGAPPGQVWLGLAGLGEVVEVRGLRLPGDRQQVRQFATTFALSLLRLHLLATA